MSYLPFMLLFTCLSTALSAPTSSLDAQHNAEKVLHVIGPLSVTTVDNAAVTMTNSSNSDSIKARPQGKTTEDIILDDLKAMSSRLSDTYNSQEKLRRKKRQANDNNAHLTVVSLDGKIDEVNLGPLRATLNK